MNPFAAAGIFVAELGAIVLLLLAFHWRGFKRGFQEGYAQARRDAENWWLRVEREMEEEERKMREAEGR